MSSKIKVAIVGVGNCAKSLVEGVQFYQGNHSDNISGIMFSNIGGYYADSIEFVAAWDVDARKVAYPLYEAIKAKPNNAFTIADDCSGVCANTIVQMGPVLDGVGDGMAAFDYDSRFDVASYPGSTKEMVVQELVSKGVDVLINYLPVGSQEATEFYMDCAIEAGVAVVNCIPVFIASDPNWQKRFVDAGIPIIGDDMRSQFGASIVSAVLQELLIKRGMEVEMHYQDNVGGNTDFANMQDKSRLASKKISKENVIKNQNILHDVPVKDYSIHAGPAQYFSALGDNKRAHWLIKAKGFGGAPIELTADLSVQDSPNSAGVVIDAIRFCKVAREMGISGPLEGASAYTQKTPPRDMAPNEAWEECNKLAHREFTQYTERQV